MDKKILIAFSAVFVLFIAGCGSGEVTTGAPTTPFLGGAGGLEIRFLEGNPPAEVTDGGTFPFNAIVVLKNVGEQDIKKNEIELSLIGFLPGQFNPAAPNNFDEAKLKDQTLLEDLSGRKRDADGNIIEPVEIFFTFPDKSDATTKNFNFNGQLAGNNIFVFRADACYKYQTRVKSDICVINNQIDPAADAICKPSEAKAVFSSGSPVKVASFRQNVAGSNKLQLSFDVEHIGQGNVFAIDKNLLQAIPIIDEAIAKAVALNKADTITKIDAAITLLTGKTDIIAKLNEAKAEVNKESPNFNGAITHLNAANGLTNGLRVDCPKDSTNRRAKEDQVIVSIDTGLLPIGTGNYKLSCVGLSDVAGATTAKQSGSVKLIGGKRTITCTLDIPASRTDFVKPVDITVDFNYAQNADKEVLVKHILTNP